MIAADAPRDAQAGILVLDYHRPEETLHCLDSVLPAAGEAATVLWLENDAGQTREALLEVLHRAAFPWVLLDPEGPLPPPGTVGVVLIQENLGYAGGNNVGLRLLHRHQVEWAWILNNDTRLLKGGVVGLLQEARARPEISAWGTRVETEGQVSYGGIVDPRTAHTALCTERAELERDPMAYATGASLFVKVEAAASVGFIPERYFLYYEDSAFSFELRRKGLRLGGTDAAWIDHRESTTTGRRSMLSEYYFKRNRWLFLQTYLPHRLRANRWRLFYLLQKYLVRFRFKRAWLELLAFLDFSRGRYGRTARAFRSGRST